MRPEGDFAAYLAARWPVLVRMLVLLGGRPEEAEDAVRSGLARDYLDWARICGGDDPDVYVYRSVLEAWRRRRGGWWNDPQPGRRDPTAGAGGPGAPAGPAHRGRTPRAGAPLRQRPRRAAGGPCSTRPPPRCRGWWPARSGGPTSRPSGRRAVNELNESMVEETFRDAVAPWRRCRHRWTPSGTSPPTSSAVAAAARGGVRRPASASAPRHAATWAGTRRTRATTEARARRHHGREPGGHRLVGGRRAPPRERHGRGPAGRPPDRPPGRDQRRRGLRRGHRRGRVRRRRRQGGPDRDEGARSAARGLRRERLGDVGRPTLRAAAARGLRPHRARGPGPPHAAGRWHPPGGRRGQLPDRARSRQGLLRRRGRRARVDGAGRREPSRSSRPGCWRSRAGLGCGRWTRRRSGWCNRSSASASTDPESARRCRPTGPGC